VAESDKEALNLYQLIGAPLVAVVQAEAQAAQVSADFIKEIGFERAAPAPSVVAAPGGVAGPAQGAESGAKTEAVQPAESARALQEGGDFGPLKMVQFTHQVRGTDGRTRTHQMDVPVLSLFPIPLLQVKDAEFDFAIRILDHETRGPNLPAGTPSERGSSSELTGFLSRSRVELKGAIARRPVASSNPRTTDMQLHVKIRMEQADMPAGLTKLLAALDHGISSTPVTDATTEPRNGPAIPDATPR
jgi:hypothetical protein